ncbi:MAG: Ppx/GppA family phosphatase, partial [Gluconacetobacter diazotrophicus]|nr:Ppx/GppA family phosphatase [Gluconacetobacter diazotrophicus]
QIARSFYPLNIVHQYELGRDEAREMASFIAGAGRRALERIPGAPRKRLEDLPVAAVVLRRLLRRLSPSRVVFCVDGVREGWYMRNAAPETMRQDPLEAASRDLSDRLGRNPNLPPALLDWTTPLFGAPGLDPVGAAAAGETVKQRGLRAAACAISDTGALDHPEYRAEQSFLRILRLPGMALDHPTRAFLALVLAVRYEAPTDSPFCDPARRLLDPVEFRRAEQLGLALSLAYALCAGVPELLESTGLALQDRRLVLRLGRDRVMFGGESVSRRLERLALSAGLSSEIVTA